MVLMTRKGGGRESGAPLSDDVPPKTPGTDEGGTGAANPAAFDCGSSGLSWSHIEHDHNRMRALEAKLALARKAYQKAASERAKLTRTLKACRDAGAATARLANDQLARVEKVDARVK